MLGLRPLLGHNGRMAIDASSLIERFGLAPHPEGGWYRETWRAPGADGERESSTAILFLLEAEQSSHWHRVDADEIWLWHAGGSLDLMTAPSEDGPVSSVRLGPGTCALFQAVVPAHAWQAARPAGDEAVLVSCVVAPAFRFDGFELAPEGWKPGEGK